MSAVLRDIGILRPLGITRKLAHDAMVLLPIYFDAATPCNLGDDAWRIVDLLDQWPVRIDFLPPSSPAAFSVDNIPTTTALGPGSRGVMFSHW